MTPDPKTEALKPCELCGQLTNERIQPDRPGHDLCQSIRRAYIEGGFHKNVQEVRDYATEETL